MKHRYLVAFKVLDFKGSQDHPRHTYELSASGNSREEMFQNAVVYERDFENGVVKSYEICQADNEIFGLAIYAIDQYLEEAYNEESDRMLATIEEPD